MVDFDKGRDLRMWIMERTGGPAAGGLTVRDVMATTAMGALIERWDDESFSPELISHIAMASYEMADAMLESRITMPPKQDDVTVEEAFGFTQPVPVEGGLSTKAQLYGEDK